MRCTRNPGSGFQHLGCGQQGFEFLQNPSKITLHQWAVVKTFDTGIHLLASNQNVNEIETFPFTLATFPSMHWYLQSFKPF